GPLTILHIDPAVELAREGNRERFYGVSAGGGIMARERVGDDGDGRERRACYRACDRGAIRARRAGSGFRIAGARGAAAPQRAAPRALDPAWKAERDALLATAPKPH